MAIRGTYLCEDCNHQFIGWRESDGPYPNCPACGVEGGFAPMSPSIIGVKAKAIDIAQKIAEENFGLTDMNDNQKIGDVAAKAPSAIQTAEADAMTKELMVATNAPSSVAPHLQGYVKSFFGAAYAGGGAPVDTLAQIQGAAPAAAEARKMGVDPIALLRDAKGQRGGIDNIQVVGTHKA